MPDGTLKASIRTAQRRPRATPTPFANKQHLPSTTHSRSAPTTIADDNPVTPGLRRCGG